MELGGRRHSPAVLTPGEGEESSLPLRCVRFCVGVKLGLGTVRVKVKFNLEAATKAQMGSGGIAPLFL
jgi:hypothetical protein